MPQALPLVAQSDLPSQVNAVEQDGYVYLPRVLGSDQVAELREHMGRLEPLAESFDSGPDPKRGFLNRAINNAFNRDPHFVQFLDYPGVIEIAEALLGADCHVIAMTSWLTGPGRPDQVLHADYQPLTLPEDVMGDPRVRVPVYIATAHYYLDDLAEEIGPTRFIPGQPPRRPPARRRHLLARTRGAEHPLQRGRRGDLSQRGVASRQCQPQRPRAPSAAGQLRAALDRPALSALSEPVSVRPGYPGHGQRAPAAAVGSDHPRGNYD